MEKKKIKRNEVSLREKWRKHIVHELTMASHNLDIDLKVLEVLAKKIVEYLGVDTVELDEAIGLIRKAIGLIEQYGNKLFGLSLKRKAEKEILMYLLKKALR